MRMSRCSIERVMQWLVGSISGRKWFGIALKQLDACQTLKLACVMCRNPSPGEPLAPACAAASVASDPLCCTICVHAGYSASLRLLHVVPACLGHQCSARTPSRTWRLL